MARSAITTPATRMMLLLGAVVVLALGMSLATPAAAFVNDDVDDDETSEAQVEDGQHDDHADDAADNGFVNDADDDREAAPTGGVDAGFGGGAGVEAGLGAVHLVAMTLLGLAIVAHTANARRTARVRA